MISINLFEITMQIVNFVILLVLLNKFLIKPVGAFIEKRSANLERDLNEAEANRLKSEALLDDQKKQLQSSHQEAREIRQKAEEAMAAERDARLEQVRQEAQDMIQAARKEIDQDVQKAQQALMDKVAELSIAVSEKVIQKNLNASDQASLIRDYLERVKN